MENNTTTRTESHRPSRLENWTLYAFNPPFARNATALSDLIARQEDTLRENRSTPMTDRIHRVLRRLDDWTLTVFNPYFASDHRR